MEIYGGKGARMFPLNEFFLIHIAHIYLIVKMSLVSGLDSSFTSTSTRPEPLKMAWITDFTIVCPDRDILVVKECLKRSSKLFESILNDDNDCNSLPLKWGWMGVVEVMRCIHTFPSHKVVIDFNMDHGTADEEMLEFCFQYEIEPTLTSIKTIMSKVISNENVPLDLEWIEFFHGFKNKDNTEPFKPQIDAILCRIANNKKELDSWLELKYNSDDMIADYKSITRKLKKFLPLISKEKLMVNILFNSKPVRCADWTVVKLENDAKEMFNCYIDKNSGLACYIPETGRVGTSMVVLGIWDNNTQFYIKPSGDAILYARKLGINTSILPSSAFDIEPSRPHH